MKLKELNKKRETITRKLLESDNLCKLLSYDGVDALDMDVLTQEEKDNLIMNKIFITPFIPNIQTFTGTSIRVLFGRINKNGANFKDIPLRFLICTHIDSWLLNNGGVRVEEIESEIEELINYKNGFGVGKVIFDYSAPFIVNEKIYGVDLVYKITEFN